MFQLYLIPVTIVVTIAVVNQNSYKYWSHFSLMSNYHYELTISNFCLNNLLITVY